MLLCKPSGTGFASATPGGALLFAAFILVFVGLGTTELRSQVITGIQDDWKSTASGLWSTAGNWSLGVAPGSTHTAVFTNLSAASSPTFTGLNISVTGIVWQSGAKAYTLANSAGGQATITLGADGLQNYSANLQTITGTRMGLVLGSSTFFDAGSSGGLTISATGTIPFNIGANTLTLKGSSTGMGTISSPVSGTGAIVKTGSGTWTLSGTVANTYTGTTTVNDGTLQFNKTSGVNALAGALTVGDGIGSTDSATARWLATNEIPTATAVSINSDGRLDLNNFSNTIGTLTLTGGSVTTGTGTLTLGGTVTGNASTTSATISGNLGLGSANRTFTINDGAATFDLNISAFVSGTVTLTKGGTGTMVLSGANNYTGATTVSAGTLNIQTATALGTTFGGTTVSNGAALQIQGNITVGNESLTLNGSGVSGTGAFRNISGSNSFGGFITLASATTITSDAGMLTLTGGIANGLFTTTFAGAGNISESGVINGSGGLIKTGSGTLTLTGSNSFLGGTTINGGTVAVSSDGNLGGPSSGVTLNAGTLEITAGFNTLRLFTLGNTGSTFQVNAGQTFTVNTAILGPGTLNKTGSGTMILGAVNLFSGGTNVTGGTLRLGAIDRLLITAPITISGGAFDLQTFTQSAGAVTLSGGSIMGTGSGTLSASSFVLQSGTANAILAGTGTVTKETAGTVTLGGANTFTGSTTITEGTLRLNSNNALGTTASGTTVANGAVLTLNNVNYSSAEPLTLNGSGISNGGALANSGTSTFAGPINAATNATINAGGGTLNLTGGVSKNGTTLTIAGGGTVNITTNGITGSAPNSDLVVDATTLVLSTANSYNGPTTIQNVGTLQLGNNNVLPTSPQTALTINTSSVFDLASYSDGVASLSGDSTAVVKNSILAGTSTLTVHPVNGVSTTFAGVIAGTNGGTQGNIALHKTGAGTLILTGTNTYSGSTTVSGGTLGASGNSGSALGSTSSITVNSGGTLLLAAGDQISNTAPMTLAGGTFAKGGFSEGTASAPGLGALTLMASGSTLDFGTGTVGVLNFASFTPGSFALTIDNWTGSIGTVGNATTDRLIFASSQSANLSSFSFNGYGAGATQFDLGNGYYEITPVAPVPEPSTWAAAAMAVGFAGWQLVRRRRLQRRVQYQS